jgi:hypothetical protein
MWPGQAAHEAYRFLSYFPRRNTSWKQELHGLLFSMTSIKKSGLDKEHPISVEKVKMAEIRHFQKCHRIFHSFYGLIYSFLPYSFLCITCLDSASEKFLAFITLTR